MGLLLDKAGYYDSRTQAGELLASKLFTYSLKRPAVLALSKGGVLVGAEIAKRLHAIMAMLLLEEVNLPGGTTMFGLMNSSGRLTYNNEFEKAEIEDFEIEYRGNIEAGKFDAIKALNAIGHRDALSPHYFKDKDVIIVTDYMENSTGLEAALQFLKPVTTSSLYFASPVAHTDILTKVHELADDSVILRVVDKNFTADHYYDEKSIPNTAELTQLMDQIVLQW